MAAILYRAVLDLSSEEDIHRRQATVWMFSKEKDLEESFTFHRCCEELNISAYELREGLIKKGLLK